MKHLFSIIAAFFFVISALFAQVPVIVKGDVRTCKRIKYDYLYGHKADSGTLLTETIYTAEGLAQKTTEYYANGSVHKLFNYKADAEGRVEELVEYYSNGHLAFKTVFEYDSLGHTSAKVIYFPDGSVFKKLVFTNNSEGKPVVEEGYYANGNRYAIHTFVYKDAGIGNIKKARLDEKGYVLENSIIYYDANGNPFRQVYYNNVNEIKKEIVFEYK